MSGWVDRLTLGPARRRRSIERRLRALDRLEAGATSRPRAGRGVDVRGIVALAVAALLACGLVIVEPSLLPAWARGLAGLGGHRLAAAPEVPDRGTYAFIARRADDPTAPVAYDPCRAIPVRINPAGAPPGGVRMVQDAMAEVSAATGLVLRYDGPSSDRPAWKSTFVPSILGHVRHRPVLVAWATKDEVPRLAGDVAGLGGSVPVKDRDGVVRYVTGSVTLDRDAFAQIAMRPDGAAQMRAIVLHEFGHVMGLAHVGDPRELMYDHNVGRLDFGVGDRAGLAKLGNGPCE